MFGKIWQHMFGFSNCFYFNGHATSLCLSKYLLQLYLIFNDDWEMYKSINWGFRTVGSPARRRHLIENPSAHGRTTHSSAPPSASRGRNSSGERGVYRRGPPSLPALIGAGFLIRSNNHAIHLHVFKYLYYLFRILIFKQLE